MLNMGTNSVQRFIRGLAWFVTFFALSIISMILLGLGAPTPAVLWLLVAAWVAGIVSKMFYILPEWERMVLLRLGKFEDVRGPGYFMIPPFLYSVAAIVDTRIETHQVEATATLTKDNVPTKVTAALEFKVENPKKAIIDVQNFRQSVIWLSTEALKNTIGSLDLKDLLSEREQIAESLKEQIDADAENYGIDVKAVRITDVDTPQSLVEELAVIARARRAATAKQLQADAEVAVAEKIAEASKILDEAKGGIRLRELQILNEMSKEESSMVIVYPYGDRGGQEIANGAASSLNSRNYMPTQE